MDKVLDSKYWKKQSETIILTKTMKNLKFTVTKVGIEQNAIKEQ